MVIEILSLIKERKKGSADGKSVPVVFGKKLYDAVFRFEIGGNDIFRFVLRHREGDESRRNVELFERTGHGVLAADRADTERDLRSERSEERGERLAPTRRIGAGPKIFPSMNFHSPSFLAKEETS